jgi:hypothetical protein
MEISMTTGARYFPQFGPLAVSGEVVARRSLIAPMGALRQHATHLVRWAPDRVLLSPTGIDLPVPDRMRMSASEP